MDYSIRKVELNHVNPGLKRAVKDTLEIYRAAVKRLCEIAMAEWDCLEGLSQTECLTQMEFLMHSTKKHKAVYPDFDRDFYKFPSYYRRSAINAAVG